MQIQIPIYGSSYYGYGFDVTLSLDSGHLIYGYGYGDFINPDPTYFDVFAIPGDYTGYGTELIDDNLFGGLGYGYGWGFEYTPYLSGDGVDIITLTATVTDNGQIPAEPENIPVVFTSEAGVILSKNVSYTNSSGQATVNVTVDSSILKNFDANQSQSPTYASYPSIGFMGVKASIPRCMVINDWKVTISVSGTQVF